MLGLCRWQTIRKSMNKITVVQVFKANVGCVRTTKGVDGWI